MFENFVVEATVVCGLEEVAADEVTESLGSANVQYEMNRPGRISFEISSEDVWKIYRLRCIERFGIVFGKEIINFRQDNFDDLKKIKSLIHCIDWGRGLAAWEISNYKQLLPSNCDPEVRFRVSCNRQGLNHSFDSQSAASEFGGEIIRKFDWTVDLEKFNMEIMLNIVEEEVRVLMSMTRYSLFRRSIISFGHATLKPTIANAMLRLGNISKGDVVCDPMCGSGSIPIEGAICWPKSFHLCGDWSNKEIVRTRKNVNGIISERGNLNLEILKWDARKLPVRDEFINVIVTDIPFGKRIGNTNANRELYPQIFSEFSRVLNQKKGRAVILSADEKNSENAMQLNENYLKLEKKLNVIIGGIKANVYILIRQLMRFKQL